MFARPSRSRAHLLAVAAAASLALTGCANSTEQVTTTSSGGASSADSAAGASSSPSAPITSAAASSAAVSSTAASSATAAAPTGTTDVAPAPTTLTVDGKQVRGWPSGVYFPEGTELAYSNTDDAGGIISITSPEPEVVIGHLRDQLGAVGLPIGPDDGTVFHFDGAGWIGIVTQSDATTTVNWSVAR